MQFALVGTRAEQLRELAAHQQRQRRCVSLALRRRQRDEAAERRISELTTLNSISQAVNAALDWLRRELLRAQRGQATPARRIGAMQ